MYIQMFKIWCTQADNGWDGNEWSRSMVQRAPICTLHFLAGICTLFGSDWLFLPTVFEAAICSRVSKTSVIGGLALASRFRHCSARVAAMKAPFCGYWPPNFVSIIRNSFLLSPKYGFVHSTRFCSTPAFVLSTARLPDNNSSNTTPKLYTSLLAVSRPVKILEL